MKSKGIKLGLCAVAIVAVMMLSPANIVAYDCCTPSPYDITGVSVSEALTPDEFIALFGEYLSSCGRNVRGSIIGVTELFGRAPNATDCYTMITTIWYNCLACGGMFGISTLNQK